MINLLFGMLLTSIANADDLSSSDTSYTGATMLEGEVDVTFSTATPLNPEENPNSYSYFSGNTLYIGNSDDAGNSVDAIIEFFWFQSSIDRGSDFYVAIVKARATPSIDDALWVTDWNDWDWDSPPVLSVEAITDVSRENGAFRWDWAVPFENYGIEAYGQVSVGNQYGIGLNGEGAVMAHGEYPITEDGSVKAAGNVQAKGFLSSDYVVQTQYEVTLYEWDVFVNGRADLMAWDVYLNLEARAEQSAYHEYFVSIQVDEGSTFTMDELNISANFDSSWWPWSGAHELGVALANLEISAPFWEPEYEEEEEEETIPVEEEEEQEVEEETPEGDDGFEDNAEENVELPGLENEPSEPVKGCSVVSDSYGLFIIPLLGILIRRER
tara:strand:+ start:3714 stop:4862 length:1149 start_codon:yes stop_codon:yes gene_type:complete